MTPVVCVVWSISGLKVVLCRELSFKNLGDGQVHEDFRKSKMPRDTKLCKNCASEVEIWNPMPNKRAPPYFPNVPVA